VQEEDVVMSMGSRPALQPAPINQLVVVDDPLKVDPTKIIKFGKTKFSDYTKVCILGKGTYGEVTRCIHISSGLEVAMKTFFFEVSNLALSITERAKRDQLLNHEGDLDP
jgi:serine/threonine protein kinase